MINKFNYQTLITSLLESEKVTKEDYKKVKSDLIACVVILGICALLLCTPAFIFIVAALVTMDENSASAFVTLVILFLGIGWCIFVCVSLFRDTMKDFDKLYLLKEKYLKNRTKDEVTQDIKIKCIKVSVFVLIIIVVFAIPIVKGKIAESKADEIYVQAEDLIWNKRDYEGAIELLENIEIDYKDKEPLIVYCQAMIDYLNGDIEAAFLSKDDMIFGYQTDEHLNRLRSFKEVLDCEYDEYLDEKYPSKNENIVVYEPTTKYVPSYNYKPSYKPDDDPYDIDRYSNEEDFYYDNYDNFIDYYEAEKYFKEHKDDD